MKSRRFEIRFVLLLFVVVLAVQSASAREMPPASSIEAGAFGTRAKPSFYNHVRDFLFRATYLNRPVDMDDAGLTQGVSALPPWADSYWPIAKGGIARRWADAGYPDAEDWLANRTYVISKPPETVSATHLLSPAEKYDLLVGDSGFGLTNKMWAEGAATFAKHKFVPLWHGLCDGWAPASFMDLNPKKSVTVPGADGRMITFYPSDIKALATRAWSEGFFRQRFVGHRCNVKNPKKDEFGRVIDESCFEVNPATWHMGIVNQIGLEKKGFVFDVTFDAEVWNHPVRSYKYEYFNPQTLEVSPTFGGASTKIADFSVDKFRKYRSPNARYVVGVNMSVYYTDVGGPSAGPVTEFKLKSIRLLYDLELDAKGEIIGGEWYSQKRPDFVWHPAPDSRPLSFLETRLTEPLRWDGAAPVPSEIRELAHASSRDGQVLSGLVDTLLRLAQ